MFFQNADPALIEIIDNKLQESAKIKLLLKEQAEVIAAIARKTAAAFKSGNKVLLCGNGGSAADAQHIAAELQGRLSMDREPLPAIALASNAAVLTALGNDYGYDEVFSRQVRALAESGDIVIGISAGGNSPNIMEALTEAKKRGAVTIAFTGCTGGLKDMADIALAVPSGDTPRIQEAYMTAGHIICHLVEKILFGGLT